MFGVDGEVCGGHEAAFGVGDGGERVVACLVEEFEVFCRDGVGTWWGGDDEGVGSCKEEGEVEEMHGCVVLMWLVRRRVGWDVDREIL